MTLIEAIERGIQEFKSQSGLKEDQIILVMATDIYEEVVDGTHIFGVEVMTRQSVPDGAFGLYNRSCLDHLEDHLKDFEKLGINVEYDVDDEELEWIPCDLCKHPLNVKMADRDDLVCPWCGDVNDIDDYYTKLEEEEKRKGDGTK